MAVSCPTCQTSNPDHETICQSCGGILHASSLHLTTGLTLRQQRYQVRRTIGEGGFGITYEAFDSIQNKPVAIKENWPERATRQGTTVIWPSMLTPQNRQEQISRFIEEARVLLSCHHPNIVKVYDCFEENNTAYIVMEFVAGKPLSKVVEEVGPLSSDQVRQYCLQVAYALKVVHANNLLHRDIKPENLILSPQNTAVLIDFGATKEFVAGQTRVMSVTLTPGYAPLEQYSYKSKRWPATDIYALCASMYELVTGQPPVASVDRIQNDTLIPPDQLVPDIDPQLESVLMTGLQIRVEDRFQSAEELINALGRSQTARLRFSDGKLSMPDFLIQKSPIKIGRSDPDQETTVDLELGQMPHTDTISRSHAEIYQEGGTWKIRDLNSANGIFIRPNGQSRFSPKLIQPHRLSSGDEIALGKVRFTFYRF